MLGRGAPKGSRVWDNSTIHRQNTGLGKFGAPAVLPVFCFLSFQTHCVADDVRRLWNESLIGTAS
jgi:hypothetical protein